MPIILGQSGLERRKFTHFFSHKDAHECEYFFDLELSTMTREKHK